MRLVVTAIAPAAEADRIGTRAVERRLAACASAVPIRSTYRWAGGIESADERLLLFKTVPKLVGALFKFLAEEHPYEVPEIVELDVPRVHLPYLQYLGETLDPASAVPPLRSDRGASGDATRRGSRRGPGARAPGRTRAPRRRR